MGQKRLVAWVLLKHIAKLGSVHCVLCVQPLGALDASRYLGRSHRLAERSLLAAGGDTFKTKLLLSGFFQAKLAKDGWNWLRYRCYLYSKNTSGLLCKLSVTAALSLSTNVLNRVNFSDLVSDTESKVANTAKGRRYVPKPVWTWPCSAAQLPREGELDWGVRRVPFRSVRVHSLVHSNLQGNSQA